MEFIIRCKECQAPLLADATIEDGVVIVEAELCSGCVARTILLAEDSEWMRNKYLKAGNAA